MFRLADPAVYNKMPLKCSLILWLLVCCSSLFLMFVSKRSASPPPPHIVFIIADDLGWGDVGFLGCPDIPTPNIDALARAGVVLHNHYAEWACSPSRGALLTGLHSLRLGLQHSVIKAGERTALPLPHTLLPQHLRAIGYSTHLLGKWHLGYHLKAHMPTERGFDSFFGYLNGVLDYYDHTNLNDGLLTPMDQIFFGVDLYNGTTLVRDTRGRYLTHLITEKARDRILHHDTDKPLFLMVSHLAPHTGANAQRLQAPPATVRRFRHHIPDKRRRIYAGMVSELDASVGAVVEALDARGMLGNALVVFVSDNGGVTDRDIDGLSSNAPLRGQKLTLWEGGVRVPAILFSPLLPSGGGRVWRGLMHISDWLPTLYSAAGGDPLALGRIDGRDAWGALTSGGGAPSRTELLLNVDPVLGQAAYRQGALKVVSGGSLPPLPPPPPAGAGAPPRGGPSVVRDICERLGLWPPPGGEEEWLAATRVRCREGGGGECDPSLKPCLFNVTEDPCEQNDLADRHPEVVSAMMARIGEFAAQAAPPQAKRRDPLADPACHGFAFVPWMEPEHLDPPTCDYLLQDSPDTEL